MTCNLPKFCKHLVITGKELKPRCKLGFRVEKTHSTREVLRLNKETGVVIICNSRETK